MTNTLEIGKLYHFEFDETVSPCCHLYVSETSDRELGVVGQDLFPIYPHAVVLCVKTGLYHTVELCRETGVWVPQVPWNQYLLLDVKNQILGWYTDSTNEIHLFQEIPT